MGTAVVADAPKAEVADAPVTIYRKDYKPTPYAIDAVYLNFVLNEDVTHVQSKLTVRPKYTPNGRAPALSLNGRSDIKLLSVKVNGQQLSPQQYTLTKKLLSLEDLPESEFELEISTEIKPQDNKLLEGLYKSSGNFCTQCEAEGFRGITYFYDRPDVMSKYTTRIEADATKYPVLLSNGNLVDTEKLEGGRHYALWEDPFVKPCYLFALVAGDLAKKEQVFTTKSGKDVALRIYVEEKTYQSVNGFQVDHALASLVKAMKWDEKTFGREYDLDLFNIVAVDDFNMGAMENKSLNIFNSRLVLAAPETATDTDFRLIEGVVGHEYFHNWTGNRVTCRDWFQLTLKEGLTVYRDQEFTSDMQSRPVKRIEDVMRLRSSQFPEDEGAMSHPVRPDSYIKMDNFYTVTVYEKGAEVVRMYSTLLSKAGFRKGTDLYFERHDGQAVACDEFLAAMADANGADLSNLKKWYGQAGTPALNISTQYNPAERTYTVRASQHTKSTSGQPNKVPVLIPVSVGLLGPDGNDMPVKLQGSTDEPCTTALLRVDQEKQEFVFTDVPSEPVPSFLRNFSAPVRMTVEGQTDEHLVFLFANDSDPFNRWEAGQRLAKRILTKLYDAASRSTRSAALPEACAAAGAVPGNLVEAFRAVLTAPDLDGAFVAMAVTLPSTSELMDDIPGADPVLLHEVRTYVIKELAARLRPELAAVLKSNDVPAGETYKFDFETSSRRALKNKALSMLVTLDDSQITEDCYMRFQDATNMTDQMGALAALVEAAGPERERALARFYEQWAHEPLVMLKWLGVQSMCNAPGNLAAVRALEGHPVFNSSNPNSCYSVFLGFTRSPVNFHASDGAGYKYLADAVLKVDKINHQVRAAVMVTVHFKKYQG